MYYVRQEKKKGKKQQNRTNPQACLRSEKFVFFRLFYRTETRQKDSFSRSFRRNFFFFPRVPWIGIESSMRVPICMHRFFYTRTCQKIPLSILTIFFFFFIRSIRISDFLKVMIMIIVNSPPRRSLLPSLDLILNLEKKGKSSEILTRSFNLRIFNFLS